MAVPGVLFLEGEDEAAIARAQLLRAALLGVDVDALVFEDPLLLTLDCSTGIKELVSLWPVHAFANCDLAELGLAIRSMSASAPPLTL